MAVLEPGFVLLFCDFLLFLSLEVSVVLWILQWCFWGLVPGAWFLILWLVLLLCSDFVPGVIF